MRTEPGHSGIDDAVHVRPQFVLWSVTHGYLLEGLGFSTIKRRKKAQVPEILLEVMGEFMPQDKGEPGFP
jgi:hypothetical protein